MTTAALQPLFKVPGDPMSYPLNSEALLDWVEEQIDNHPETVDTLVQLLHSIGDRRVIQIAEAFEIRVLMETSEKLKYRTYWSFVNKLLTVPDGEARTISRTRECHNVRVLAERVDSESYFLTALVVWKDMGNLSQRSTSWLSPLCFVVDGRRADGTLAGTGKNWQALFTESRAQITSKEST
jgi:hypothetical protein